MSNQNGIKVFAGSSGRDFAIRICDYLGSELGQSKVITFSEGNTYVKVEETVRDKDVYLVQSIGLKPNDEFAEILFWIDAFKRASANSVTVIMPYYSYAKGDKKDEPRVSIRGRVCADCIEVAGADRVVTMDLHSPQIQGFFKKPVDHLFALPILCEYIKSLQMDDLVVVAPDSGFAKEARKFARYLKLPVAIGDKEREDHSENAKIIEIVGEVKGKNALIVDDFSISGGTLVDLAIELKNRGAKKIIACLSHILLNEKGVEKLENSPIEMLISTDSVNNPYVESCDKVKLVSVAPLFAETIRRIHNRQSVSPLFKEVPIEVLDSGSKY
ncbi:ribose-phosphate diphosphokinase [Vallitalea pronyensis]|uniref:ribose-phosphate diphosphokinase n=1 Tax=Vallitalea pronyensis TaxID=1348613 RepID=A0A8J8SHL5_9FIRM|nr:ribose-phosphate diphosphokinase [Vallitalea pronyensis]QUI23564.1 ribose-phosphate diphosphokinase [Vallitalea pronyensis]